MASILPADTRIIEQLKTDLITTLTVQREHGCDLAAIRSLSDRYAEEVRKLVTRPTDFNASDVEGVVPVLEWAYQDWTDVSNTFSDTIRLAFNETLPEKNLALDHVHADLHARVGDPLSARYTELRRTWRSHLDARPWDAYRASSESHVDAEELDDALTALVRGDELDVEDALNSLAGDLRYAFADLIESDPNNIADMEIALWRRPEIVVSADYWGNRRVSLVDVLKHHGSPRFAGAFAKLDTLFNPTPDSGQPSAEWVVDRLNEIPEDQRERFTRCLMLHPDHEVRRYAVANVEIDSIWSVITPENVPYATILSLLERLVSSTQYNVTHKKVFFDAVYRRLMSATSRTDVMYVRGIVRILTQLNFLLEDEYFNKLMKLIDHLEAKQRLHRIGDDIVSEYVEMLKKEKARVGAVETQTPDFGEIPLVVLRKLARDGHFWFLIAMHPIVKIARETIPHVNSPDRAAKIAGSHRVNQEVLRIVGKKRSLFTHLTTKLALMSNPRTPVSVSLDYVNDLTAREAEQLLRRGTIHPDLRKALRERLSGTRA